MWRSPIRSIACDVFDSSYNKPCCRMLGEATQMCLHSVWRQAVVSIDEQDVFAISGTESDIACLGHASIFLTQASRKGIVRYNRCSIIE